MAWFIGVDVGGTFTDFYAFDYEGGIEHVHKVPSTPDNPAAAIIAGLRDLTACFGVVPEEMTRIAHGTTVATNTLIQRRGGSVAVITTAGFRDLLEIGRQRRPKLYDLKADAPPPLVPRERRFEVEERITADGSVVVPLTDLAIARVVDEVRAADVEACAVCLLFAFLGGAHETRIGSRLAEALPDLDVSLSSDVQPEFREYERFSTTLLNAYLQPVVGRYMTVLAREVAALAPRAAVRINQSSGGLMSVERAARYPIRTALSGPAAGTVGAIHLAGLSGRPDLITLDMGGTSADVCLIRDQAASVALDREVAGFPVRMPAIDIHTVGAGGGSIAWFDRDGLLKVGPDSAGAEPGPACYGRGGEAPTVSDANLVLGRLPPAGLLGATMRLDVEAARRALAPIADRLGTGVEAAAHGVLQIVVANMVRAIRAISIERGHDPRAFTLMAFGGAGALHAGDVARALGIGEILVPTAPGILSAEGLVIADLKEDFVTSGLMRAEDGQRERIMALVDELRDRADAWFAEQGVPGERRALALVFDMRYVGQNFELLVPIEACDSDRLSPLPPADALRRLFFAAHEMNYGYANPDDPVEIVNLRLTAKGGLRKPAPPRFERAAGPPEPVGKRPVHFEPERPHQTAVFERARLAPGHVVEGPAVIEQLDATTIVHPGDRAEIDDVLNLVIRVSL